MLYAPRRAWRPAHDRSTPRCARRTRRRRGPSSPLTVPPASTTSKAPAAMSQGKRRSSQKPSKRPAATYARSSAADPSRRTAWASSRNAANTWTWRRRSSRMLYGKPVQSSASTSVRRGRHADRHAVQPRALPAFGGEQLFADRVVDDAERQLARNLERDGNRKEREPVREVRRAVHRIENPAELAGRRGGETRLLADDHVRRETASDEIAEHPLGFEIGGRDQIDAALFLNVGLAAEIPAMDAAGIERRLDGRGQVAAGRVSIRPASWSCGRRCRLRAGARTTRRP